jgi:hypothetical protein
MVNVKFYTVEQLQDDQNDVEHRSEDRETHVTMDAILTLQAKITRAKTK